MNVSDRILELLRGGISNLTFGISPQGRPFVQAQQGLRTGGEGNITNIAHQKCADSVAACLDGLTKDIKHMAELNQVPVPDNLIEVPRGNSQ